MVKEAFSGIFRTEKKNVLYLKQLFIFKYKLTYQKKILNTNTKMSGFLMWYGKKTWNIKSSQGTINPFSGEF